MWATSSVSLLSDICCFAALLVQRRSRLLSSLLADVGPQGGAALGQWGWGWPPSIGGGTASVGLFQVWGPSTGR